MPHTGHSSPLGATVVAGGVKVILTRHGRSSHHHVRQEKTILEAYRMPQPHGGLTAHKRCECRLIPLMTTVVDAVCGGVYDHRTREKEWHNETRKVRRCRGVGLTLLWLGAGTGAADQRGQSRD